jgi:hypothetical protein
MATGAGAIHQTFLTNQTTSKSFYPDGKGPPPYLDLRARDRFLRSFLEKIKPAGETNKPPGFL